MTKDAVAPKLRALCLHLAVTSAVAGGLLWVFVRYWFPMPYFVADGGWQGFRLILAVNLILGPALTFVVFRPTKSRRALLLDCSVIAGIQLAALGFGLWTTYAHRTLMVIFADGTFYTVDADAASQIGGNAPGILRASMSTPAFAAVHMPDDEAGRQRLRKESLGSGRPLYSRGELLEPLDARAFEAVREREVDVSGVTRKNPAQRRELENFLQKRGGAAAQYVFVPLSCRYDALTLAWSRSTDRLEGWLWIALPKGAGLRLGRLRGAPDAPPSRGAPQ